jgi:hypothetical protein
MDEIQEAKIARLSAAAYDAKQHYTNLSMMNTPVDPEEAKQAVIRGRTSLNAGRFVRIDSQGNSPLFCW